MKNIKLTIQYDGTRYQGWQKPGKKGNSNTISGKLTEVISRITDEETTLFAGAKTDTNVHAECALHILAPAAVACDTYIVRRSAHP